MLLKMNVGKLYIANIFIIILALCNSETNLDESKNTYDIALYGSNEASISYLQEAWLKGDIEAGGHLSFARALGSGIDQDLREAIKLSNDLWPAGAARAYTTLGLLLNHNLTEENLPKEERESKAINNYAIAAAKGDPFAQIIVGEHYYTSQKDCMSALTYYRKAASLAILSVKEVEMSRSTFVQYIWEEDSPLPPGAYPTQEQLHFFEHLATHGDADAAMQAASLLFGGAPGIKIDLGKGTEYLKMAIERNNTNAMVWLAQMYLRGIVEGNDFEALELLEKALKYGNDLAYAGMGRIYMEGIAGVTKNSKLAEAFLKKGIAAGNLDAFFQLGKLYSMNEGNGDTSKAAEIWQIPAAIGHVHSAWNLAEYYRKLYTETTPNYLYPNPTGMSERICEVVVPLYRLVAQSGEWKELFQEAYADYVAGRQGASLLKYLLLSDVGYSAAHVNAARILEEGGSEIYNDSQSNCERALAAWQRAARDGVAKGYAKVGDHFYYGMGIEKDLIAAAEHYEKSSRMGDPEGGFSYALVTEWGEGVPQDIEKAKQIYQEITEKHSDAEIPIFLATARMYTFLFINNTLNIDLYSFSFDYNKFEWNSLLSYFDLTLPNWDIILIICLLCFIFISVYIRR